MMEYSIPEEFRTSAQMEKVRLFMEAGKAESFEEAFEICRNTKN
jgi:hypothetical protein